MTTLKEKVRDLEETVGELKKIIRADVHLETLNLILVGFKIMEEELNINLTTHIKKAKSLIGQLSKLAEV